MLRSLLKYSKNIAKVILDYDPSLTTTIMIVGEFNVNVSQDRSLPFFMLSEFQFILHRNFSNNVRDHGFFRRIEGFNKHDKETIAGCVYWFHIQGYSEQLENIQTVGLDSPESLSVIVDMGQLFASVYDNFTRTNELDNNSFVVSIGRLIGSSVEFLSSLNLGIYEELKANFTETASNYAPILGLIVENALQIAPHLRYMGIVSSLFDVFRCETIINNVRSAMQEDKIKFEPLKTWFEETDEFDATVKKLFPYEIDKDLINVIEKNLKDLESDRKTFASILISNVKENSKLMSDDTFLTKVFIFSRTEAAKEWYSRIANEKNPVGQESALIYFRNELRELEKVSPDSESSLAISLFSVKAQALPRFILSSMNFMAAIHSVHRVIYRPKHRYSDNLRDLAKHAQFFYNSMEKIRINHS
ncbi:uncharacterized protein TNCT_733661 [Trichonephila clavata]|uniref:Uncharacterized protein n=1 Tax=Trichonephila clavata TaxID=2740835 RepID=A0A8X6I147_TRICU|nr:uncharacterized protein TNCT_733661 [Trichonephila clavata]